MQERSTPQRPCAILTVAPLLLSVLVLACTPSLAGSSGLYGSAFNMNGLANMQVGGNSGNASNVFVSYRFRAERSDTLTAFRAMWLGTQYSGYGGGTGGTIRVSVEKDNGGVPSGVALATYDYAHGAGPLFPLLTFPSPATLKAGELYHLVFTNIDPSPRVNFVSVDLTWGGSVLTQRQPKYPDSDFAALRRTPDSPWAVQGQYTPILDLTYASGAHQGQGYQWADTANKAVIAGPSHMARERFTVSGGSRVVTGAAIRIAKTAGTGNLLVRLEDGSGTLIDSFSVSTDTVPTYESTGAGDAPAGIWVSGSFSSARTLTTGATYNLRLSTDSATSLWSRPIEEGGKYGFDKATYFADGHAQVTTNGGSTWTTVAGLGTTGDLQFHLH